tara:strand:- start:1575 stop:2306 length:732 start_codon:yes stop_codon:yes gene_type:complete
MDLMKEETLVKVGLTKNEAKVYLSLLRLGSASVVEITKHSRVHRVNVYDVLERLREKGLISSIMQSNKRIYEAASPTQLAKLIEEKQVLLNQIMPNLKEEFKIKKSPQEVHHFIGPEGIMQAYYMMLDQKETIYALGTSGLNRTFLKHRHEMWDRERKKRNIKGQLIYYEFKRKDKVWGVDKTVELRYLPDSYKTLGSVDICGDLVVNLLPVENNVMAIVIENRILADTYRSFFNFIWDKAKK